MNTTTSTRTVNATAVHRAAAAVAAVALGLTTAAAPAWARQDVGAPTPSRAERAYPHCLLERLDDQLVRCDDLTGTGAPAPLAVPPAS